MRIVLLATIFSFLFIPAVGNLLPVETTDTAAVPVMTEEPSLKPEVLGLRIDKEERKLPRAQMRALTADLDDRGAVVALPLRAPLFGPPQRKPEARRLFLPEAAAAVVIDVDSGKILFDQNASELRPIASLTKLYTAYLVRQANIPPHSVVTVTADDLRVVGSRVGCENSYTCAGRRLQVGEKLTVEDLLAAMLVSSANDAANILARYVSGSRENFVTLMNKRAREMGFEGVNFCTPSGLESVKEGERCLASAEMIARVAVQALSDDFIWKFLRTKEMTISSVDGKITHKLDATNRFAEAGDMIGMIGAKTGFTPQAGYSLLLAVKHPQNQARIVAVILGDPRRWEDMKTLVEWTFDSYEWN